jgi:hypothetical protein
LETLDFTPVNVKLCESPSQAGGLPKSELRLLKGILGASGRTYIAERIGRRRNVWAEGNNLYRQNHGLTVTSNYTMRDLIECERLHPAIVCRLDNICRVLEL